MSGSSETFFSFPNLKEFIHEDPSFGALKTCSAPRWEWGTGTFDEVRPTPKV